MALIPQLIRMFLSSRGGGGGGGGGGRGGYGGGGREPKPKKSPDQISMELMEKNARADAINPPDLNLLRALDDGDREIDELRRQAAELGVGGF